MIDLKSKVGPFPAYVWGIILGVLIVGFVFISNRNKSTTKVTPTADDAATPNLAGWRDTSGFPAAGVVNSGDVSTDTATNTSWLAQGVKYAQSVGFTALDSEAALRRYLEGTNLSTKDASIVNAVNTSLGLPPDGVGGTPTISPGDPDENATTAYYVRKAGTSAVYAVYPNKTRKWLTSTEYAALGAPRYYDISPSDAIWGYPVVGPDGPDTVTAGNAN